MGHLCNLCDPKNVEQIKKIRFQNTKNFEKSSFKLNLSFMVCIILNVIYKQMLL